MKPISISCLLLLAGISVQAQISVLGGNAITITSSGIFGSNNGPNRIYNVALGPFALMNSTASNNTGIGAGALLNNTTGTSNVALGNFALTYNIDGFNNTASGYNALQRNQDGNNNTANGSHALYSNTIGNNNTAMGANALQNSTIGNSNTAVGFEALVDNTEGSSNTAFGSLALSHNTTGINNVSIGAASGLYNITGNRNTFIGYNADANANNRSNATAIGNGASVNASNKVRIGNSAVTVIEGQVAWTNPSDRRLKENIVYTSALGLEFIKRLRTVSYNFIADASKTRHDGFIAQDIEAVMKELNLQFSGLKKADDGTYSLAYSDFVMPLVNAVKEQQTQITAQQHEIDTLKQQLARINNLEKQLESVTQAHNNPKQ